jgi:hypothetical protein
LTKPDVHTSAIRHGRLFYVTIREIFSFQMHARQQGIGCPLGRGLTDDRRWGETRLSYMSNSQVEFIGVCKFKNFKCDISNDSL